MQQSGFVSITNPKKKKKKREQIFIYIFFFSVFLVNLLHNLRTLDNINVIPTTPMPNLQLCQMASAIAASSIAQSSVLIYNAYPATTAVCLKYLYSKCFQHAPALPGKHINQLLVQPDSYTNTHARTTRCLSTTDSPAPLSSGTLISGLRLATLLSPLKAQVFTICQITENIRFNIASGESKWVGSVLL